MPRDVYISKNDADKHGSPEDVEAAQEAYENLRASDIGECDRVPVLVPAMLNNVPDAVVSEEDLSVEQSDSSDECLYVLPNTSRQHGVYISHNPHGSMGGKDPSGEHLPRAKEKVSSGQHIPQQDGKVCIVNK